MYVRRRSMEAYVRKMVATHRKYVKLFHRWYVLNFPKFGANTLILRRR